MKNSRHIIRLLAIEQLPNDVERWVKLFRNAGQPSRVQHVVTIEDLEKALKSATWDAILSTEETTDLKAQQILKALDRKNLDIPVIITLSDYYPDRIAAWLTAGAQDAIPTSNEKHILQAVRREVAALDKRRQLLEIKQTLEETQKRCELLLANASDAIAYIHYGMFVDANQAYLDLFGYQTKDDLVGLSLIDVTMTDDQDLIRAQLKQLQTSQPANTIDCQLAHKNGDYLPVSLEMSEAQYENEPCLQITAHSKSIPLLNQTAEEEGTGAYREKWFSLADQQMRASEHSALIWVQIDNYDTLRRDTNVDGILSVQQSIMAIIRESQPDTAFCHYGDNVFLIMNTIGVAETLYPKLFSLQSAIDSRLFGSNEKTLTVSTSIGFVFRKNEEGLAALIDCAEIAHDQCSQDEQSRIKEYSPSEEMQARASEGDLQAAVEHALTQETFQLSYQPVINVTGTDEQAYEVFVKIPGVSDQLMNIADCRDTPELENLMPHVDRWALRQSVLELARKRKEGENSRLLISLSSWSVKEKKFITYIGNLIRATKLPAESIVLQFQEDVALQQLKGILEFSKLTKKLGCLLAIDNFQGGDYSLKLLQHLDIDIVHLHRNFSKALAKTKNEDAIKKLNAAKEYNIQCIASEINSSKDIAMLWNLGIEYAQGDYIGAPSESMNYEFE